MPILKLMEAFTEEQLTAFQQSFLDAHNDKRALHAETLPLALDAALSTEAQTYADTLVEANAAMPDLTANFGHDEEIAGGTGENIHFAAGSFPTLEEGINTNISDSVDAWYGEIDNFNFEKPEDNFEAKPGSSHFAQIVWKATTLLGVGFGIRDDFKYKLKGTDYILQAFFMVLRYKAIGSEENQYTANVMPLIPVEEEPEEEPGEEPGEEPPVT